MQTIDDLGIFPFLQSSDIPPYQHSRVYIGIFCTYLEKASCNALDQSHCSLDFQLSSNTVPEPTRYSFILSESGFQLPSDPKLAILKAGTDRSDVEPWHADHLVLCFPYVLFPERIL